MKAYSDWCAYALDPSIQSGGAVSAVAVAFEPVALEACIECLAGQPHACARGKMGSDVRI
jgi:hypothetical protein